MSIAEKTKRLLLARSGGFCGNPACNVDLYPLFENREITNIEELAHIIGQSEEGPRGEDMLSIEERDDFDNIILLCPTCHTKIDKFQHLFPAQTIREWTRRACIICIVMVFVVTIAVSQTIPRSKWKVDKQNYFLYQNCITSGQNDTIIFIGIVSFHSDLLNIDSVDKITYAKNAKKLILCGTKHGTIKISDKIEKKMLIPITEILDSYPIDTIEYVIGERTVYFK